MLKKIFILCNVTALLATGTGLVMSCIRAEQPNINMDIINNTELQTTAKGIVKTTVQENSVTMYADMSVVKLDNLDSVKVSVSPHATWSFIDVTLNKRDTTIQGFPTTITDTIVGQEISVPKDFSQTRYIKVTCEAEGLNEDDFSTQKVIDSQKSMFIGWENDKVLSKKYTQGAHLFKIWAINVLPAGIPTSLTFDNWATMIGCDYQLPFEMVQQGSQMVRTNIWTSTNASIALMAKANDVVLYGARPTDDVAVSGTGKKALLLTSNDIRFTNTFARPFLAGCCFVGEFDGSDTGALTCTHVGLPFNKKPESLSFWYKYQPMTIIDPNQAEDYSYQKKLFNVPDIAGYVGKQDKGFIRAVFYRADGKGKRDAFLDGETIRDLSDSRVIAYAEFIPQGEINEYIHVEKLTFKYLKSVNEEDLKNWKYNLAIYFASSYDGFRFIAGANMNNQFAQFYQLKMQLAAGAITKEYYDQEIAKLREQQMGSKLYIDEMEINCEE